MSQKILIAMDDSENSMRGVDYVANCLSKDSEITLFSVLMDTVAICDMHSPELTPYFKSQRDGFCSIEAKKKELVDQALIRAKEKLVSAGFDESAIRIKVETKNRSIARDIIDEAHRGYDALVIGRRGLSGIKEFFIGSVSHKVLNALNDVSIVLAT